MIFYHNFVFIFQAYFDFHVRKLNAAADSLMEKYVWACRLYTHEYATEYRCRCVKSGLVEQFTWLRTLESEVGGPTVLQRTEWTHKCCGIRVHMHIHCTCILKH